MHHCIGIAIEIKHISRYLKPNDKHLSLAYLCEDYLFGATFHIDQLRDTGANIRLIPFQRVYICEKFKSK